MGLLDQVLGNVTMARRPQQTGSGVPGGMGLNSPVVKALMLMLAAKAAQSYLARRSNPGNAGLGGGVTGGNAQAQTAPAGPAGGLGGMLGSVLGGGGAGGGLGGLLAGVAGGGGLGALVDHFSRNGCGDVIGSWIGHGPNQEIAPNQLAQALGDDTVEHLQAESGMPREELLSELSTALPQAVDQLTPNGTLPGPDETQHW